MITIPFDLELAKKINNGERNGMIVTDGDNYRVESLCIIGKSLSQS